MGGCACESLGHCSRRHACDEPAPIEYSIGSEGAKSLATVLAGTQRTSMAPKPRTADEWSKFIEEEERLEHLEELAEKKDRVHRECGKLKTDGVIPGNGSHSTAAAGAATNSTGANTGFSNKLQNSVHRLRANALR